LRDAGTASTVIDNNMRADFFGPQGDTSWRLKQLGDKVKSFTHHNLDIRNRAAVLEFFSERRIGAVAHCAAQPSHDLAKDRPFDDFDVNAGGSLNLLEAARRYCPEAPFIFMSTNKVYGDAPTALYASSASFAFRRSYHATMRPSSSTSARGSSATLSINAKTVEVLSDGGAGNSRSTGRSPCSVSGVRLACFVIGIPPSPARTHGLKSYR
jgi:nucleoside-diphosphate-sugar epimerase